MIACAQNDLSDALILGEDRGRQLDVTSDDQMTCAIGGRDAGIAQVRDLARHALRRA